MDNSNTSRADRQKRKKLLIYPSFQIRLIIINSVFTLFCFVIVELLLLRSFGSLKGVGTSINLPAEHPYFKFLSFQLNTLNAYLLGAFVICALASGLVTLFFSHRMVGPIVRLKSYFTDIETTGNVPSEPLSFRKNDFFDDLPAAINGAIKKVLRK